MLKIRLFNPSFDWLSLCKKVSIHGVFFSGSYFPIFSPNTEKYGSEKTQCLDTLHAVFISAVPNPTNDIVNTWSFF